jgi:hypothetical protein
VPTTPLPDDWLSRKAMAIMLQNIESASNAKRVGSLPPPIINYATAFLLAH